MTKVLQSCSVHCLSLYAKIYAEWRTSVSIDLKCNRCNVNITLWQMSYYKAFIIHCAKCCLVVGWLLPLTWLWFIASLCKHLLNISSADVLRLFCDHISRRVYVFANLSILVCMFWLVAHVSLEIMPRASSICGHECYCVALSMGPSLHGGAKISS